MRSLSNTGWSFHLPRISSRRVITVPTFASLGMMGVFHAFWGTALPALRLFLDINIEKAAILTAYTQAGQAAACVLGGVLCDLFRRDRVLFLGCLLLGTGALFLGGIRSFEITLFVALGMGFGCGLILSSSNALLVGLYPNRKGPILNIHHSVYGAVSLFSPLVMGYLISSGHGWTQGYRGLGWILIVTCSFFLLTDAPLPSENTNRTFFKDLGGLFRKGEFIFLLLIAAMSIGTQIAIMFLSVTFLSEVKGFSIIEASAVLSGFFIFLLAGRLMCSWLALRTQVSKIIFGLVILQLCSLIVAWQGRGWFSAGAIVVSGLACSGIFPGLLALTGTLYFDMAGSSLGILASMNWIGGMLIVWISGIVSQRMGLEFGFVAIVGSSLVGVALFLSRYRVFVREEKKLALL